MSDELNEWAFNVMLECDGRAEDELPVVIGGAVLNLRDLRRILDGHTALFRVDDAMVERALDAWESTAGTRRDMMRNALDAALSRPLAERE